MINKENCLHMKKEGRRLDGSVKAIIPTKLFQVLLVFFDLENVDISKWSSYAREVSYELLISRN